MQTAIGKLTRSFRRARRGRGVRRRFRELADVQGRQSAPLREVRLLGFVPIRVAFSRVGPVPRNLGRAAKLKNILKAATHECT